MRIHVLRGLVAGVCVAAAVVLVLVALDARAWSTRIPADDLRYARDPTARGLWQPRQLAPGGLARAALGIDDDLAYRRALRQFRISRPLEPMFSTEATTRRIEAQVELTKLVANGSRPARRAQAANLLGVLGFTLSSQDSGQPTLGDGVVNAFRRAVAIDPQNDDALFNLEYALDQQKGNGDQGGPNNRAGRGNRAGLNSTGHGY